MRGAARSEEGLIPFRGVATVVGSHAIDLGREKSETTLLYATLNASVSFGIECARLARRKWCMIMRSVGGSRSCADRRVAQDDSFYAIIRTE